LLEQLENRSMLTAVTMDVLPAALMKMTPFM
jgi:hypothetical protein